MSEEKKILKHWHFKPLGDVLDIQGGSQPAKSNFIYEPKDGYIQLLQIRDFGEKGHPTFVPKKLVTKFCKKDDILIARYGASLGRIVTGHEGAYNVALAKVIDDKGVFEKRFIFYLLKTQIFQTPLAMLSRSAQNGFSKGEIARIELPIPPLPEQQAIVAKIEELLSDLENGKQQLQTAQQQLKVYRQSLLKWAFEGKLTNKKVKEGELPKGWKWVKLNEACKIIGGVTKGRDLKGKTSIQLPYLRVANVQDGYLDLRQIKTIEVLPSDKEKYQLLYGDILYTEGGDKDKLGRGTIWKNEIKNCIHQNHIFRARPLTKDINSKYIAYYSQTRTAKNYFFKHGKQTTNLASINLTILSNLPLPLCTIKEQNHIVDELESKLTVCDNIEETISHSLQQAETLRQSILKKAFEGKLVKNHVNP